MNSSEYDLEKIGALIIRYGLVIILLWIGGLKFTMYEAEGIKPLLENSGLMSWGYSLMSVQGFSILIGIIEIILGILIALYPFAPKISAWGSYGTIVMAIVTLSFILTTPSGAIWQDGQGFPFLSPMPGQFLLMDLLLLGSAVSTAGEARNASMSPQL